MWDVVLSVAKDFFEFRRGAPERRAEEAARILWQRVLEALNNAGCTQAFDDKKLKSYLPDKCKPSYDEALRILMREGLAKRFGATWWRFR